MMLVLQSQRTCNQSLPLLVYEIGLVAERSLLIFSRLVLHLEDCGGKSGKTQNTPSREIKKVDHSVKQ